MAGKAGRPRKNQQVFIVPQKGNVDALIDFDDVESEDFENALQQFSDSSDVKIFVHESVDGKATGAHLFSCDPATFSMDQVLEDLRREFGSGNYIVVLKKKGVVKKSENLSIKLSRSQQQAFDARVPVNHPMQSAPGGDQLGVLIAKIEQANQQRSDQMFTLVTKMIESNGSRPVAAVAPAEPLSQVLTALGAVKGFFGGGEKGGGDMDRFFEGVEFARKFGGDGGGESILATAIRELAPGINALVTVPRGTVASQQGSRQLPAPAAPVAAATPDTASDDAEFQVIMNMICRAAKRDLDTDVYAELLIDQLGEEEVYKYFSSDAMFAMVVAQIPPDIYTAYTKWFDQLRESVLGFFTSDSPDGEGATNVHSNKQENLSSAPGGAG